MDLAFAHAATLFAPKVDRFPTPGALAEAVDPTTVHTPALDLIDQALIDVEAGRCDRLILSMAPQQGKSTRCTTIGALWFLLRNPNRRVAVVSYSADLADTFGRQIRGMITSNQGQEGTLDLGLRIAPDNGAVSSWQIDGRKGGVRSVGIAGGLTGRPCDVLFIDDPVANRKRAESEQYRREGQDFWTSVGGTRLAPGAPVIVILTRWHEADLAGWLQGREDGHRWRVINIPAQANHDPAKGQTDPLGREPGEYMESARRNEAGEPLTAADWEAIKVQAGARDWEALYQGHPSPPEGGILQRGWWQQYETPLWEVRPGRRPGGYCVVAGDYVEMWQSWDCAFKDTKGSDYVVGQVWLRLGAQVFLLDQVRARLSFVKTCEALTDLSVKWPQSVLKLVEDKANGTAVINQLSATVSGLVPEEPHGSKYARASAVSPYVQAGNVFLPSPRLAPWVDEFIEECAGFPTAAHDDQVDAFSQALNRILLSPYVPDEVFEPDELADAEDELSYLV